MSSSPFCLEHVIEGNTAKAFRAIFEHYARDQYCSQPILSFQNYLSLLRAVPGVSETLAHHQRNSSLFYSYLRQGLNGLLLDDFLAVVVDLSMDMYGKNNEGPMVSLTYFLTHNLFKIRDTDQNLEGNANVEADYFMQNRVTRRRTGALGMRSRSISNNSQNSRFSFSSNISAHDRNYSMGNSNLVSDPNTNTLTSNFYGHSSNTTSQSAAEAVPIFPLLNHQAPARNQQAFSQSVSSGTTPPKYDIAPRTLSFQDPDVDKPYHTAFSNIGNRTAVQNRTPSCSAANATGNQFNPMQLNYVSQLSPKNTYHRSKLVPPVSPVQSISRSSSIQSIDQSPYFPHANNYNNAPTIPTLSLANPTSEVINQQSTEYPLVSSNNNPTQPPVSAPITNLVRSSSNTSAQSKTSRSSSNYTPRPLPSRSTSAASLSSFRVPRSGSNASGRSVASRVSTNAGPSVLGVHHGYPRRATSSDSAANAPGYILSSLPIHQPNSLVSTYSIPMQKELLGSPIAAAEINTDAKTNNGTRSSTPLRPSADSPLLKGESILDGAALSSDVRGFALTNPSRSSSTPRATPHTPSTAITSTAITTTHSNDPTPTSALSDPPALRRLSLYTDPSSSLPPPHVLSSNEAPDSTQRSASMVSHPSRQPLLPRERGRHRSTSQHSVGSYCSPMTKPSGSVEGEPGSNTTPNLVSSRRSDSVDSVRSKHAEDDSKGFNGQGHSATKGPYKDPSGRNIRDPLPSPPLHFVAETAVDGKPTNAETIVYKAEKNKSNRMLPLTKLQEQEEERNKKSAERGKNCGRWTVCCCRQLFYFVVLLLLSALLVSSGILYLLHYDSVPPPMQSHPLVISLQEGVLPSIRYFLNAPDSTSVILTRAPKTVVPRTHTEKRQIEEVVESPSNPPVEVTAFETMEEIQWDFSNGHDFPEL